MLTLNSIIEVIPTGRTPAASFQVQSIEFETEASGLLLLEEEDCVRLS